MFWPQKVKFWEDQQFSKMPKITYSLKHHFLHFLAKFKGKKEAKNYKNIDENDDFVPKKLLFEVVKIFQQF